MPERPAMSRRIQQVFRRHAAVHDEPTASAVSDSAPPTLSVVIPVYNVEKYLPQCLESVLNQTLKGLEVIAVDDGSTDGSLSILHDYAVRDPRVRVLTQENSGQGIARNKGVALARGEFLAFCDSDDVVPRTAYRSMVETLRRTSSDFVVGAARRFQHGRFRPVSWGRGVHDRDRLGVTIESFPAAMRDIIACNRVFRTAFWRDQVGGFRGHIAYEDHVPMLAAYVRARQFDVLATVTYEWREREDRTSTGQQKARIENLLDRIAVKEEAAELLRAEASPATFAAWVGRCLDVDFPPFFVHALSGTDMYRNVLSAAVTTFLGRADEAALAQVGHRSKVRAWLCATGQWDLLTEADDALRGRGSVLPLQMTECGKVQAEPDPDWEWAHPVPADSWQVADRDLVADAALLGCSVADAEVLVKCLVVIPGLSSEATPGQVTATWTADTGARISEIAEAEPSVETDLWARHRRVRYPTSAFTLRFPTARFVTPGTSQWTLHLTFTQSGISSEVPIHQVVPGSGASATRSAVAGGRRIVCRIDSEAGLQLSVTEPTGDLLQVLSATATTLAGRLALPPGEQGATLVAVQQPGGDRLRFPVTSDGAFDLILPPGSGSASDQQDHSWALRLRCSDGAVEPVRWTPAARDRLAQLGAGPWWRSEAGEEVSGWPSGVPATVSRIALTGSRLDLTLETTEQPTSALLVGDHLSLAAEQHREPGQITFMLPSATGLPFGTYRLLMGGTAARLTDAAQWSAPLSLLGVNRIRVQATRAGELRLRASAPVVDSLRTAAGQEGLRRAIRGANRAIHPRLVFLHGVGQRPADRGWREVAQALTSLRPELDIVLSADDESMIAPPGTRTVVSRSEEWHECLATAQVVGLDGELDPWIARRPEQHVVRLFAAVPTYAFGELQWRRKGMPAARIERLRERFSDYWSMVLAPTPETADAVRNAFAFSGPIEVVGVPRLTTAKALRDDPASRSALREQLGTADRRAVLWVPGIADAGTDLPGPDLPAAAAAADGWQFWVHDPVTTGLPTSASAVVDATQHPLAELLGACDVLLTDFSSARLDAAVLGVPVIVFDAKGSQGDRVAPVVLKANPVAVVSEEARLAELLRDQSIQPLADFHAADAAHLAAARISSLL